MTRRASWRIPAASPLESIVWRWHCSRITAWTSRSGRRQPDKPWPCKIIRALMPLDPRVKRFLNLLAAGNPPDARRATVEERRAGLAALMKFAGPEVAVDRVEERTLPGPGGALRIRLYSPVHAEVLPGLVYFHGGGWSPAPWTPMTRLRVRWRTPAQCACCRWTTGLLPSTPFPPRWKMPWLRFGMSAGMPLISESTP